MPSNAGPAIPATSICRVAFLPELLAVARLMPSSPRTIKVFSRIKRLFQQIFVDIRWEPESLGFILAWRSPVSLSRLAIIRFGDKAGFWLLLTDASCASACFLEMTIAAGLPSARRLRWAGRSRLIFRQAK